MFLSANTVFKSSGQPAKLNSKINASVFAQPFMGNPYQYFLTGIINQQPDIDDTLQTMLLLRDIYQNDNIAGSAVDMISSFPFSDYELRGLKDSELEIFKQSLAQIDIVGLLAKVSLAYMVDGFYCGTLLLSKDQKLVQDIMTHDALQCNIRANMLQASDPVIHVTTNQDILAFLNANTEYSKAVTERWPLTLKNALLSGQMILDPLSTVYVPRSGLTNKPFQSFLQRILPMYLLEKALYKGTYTEAVRRQRSTTHIQMGDDIWTPTDAELAATVNLFMESERDPLGGWVVTRNGVNVSEIKPGGEFWKWTELSDTLTPYKLRALGISEAFLSGDASFASAESAFSVFLETCNSHRMEMTRNVITNKIFPLIALTNDLVKDGKHLNTSKVSAVELLTDVRVKGQLKIPEIHWHKQLTSKSEESSFDMLEKLSEKGVPIAIKTWAAAAGYDIDTLIKDSIDNQEYKARFAKLGIGNNNEEEPLSTEASLKKVGVLNRDWNVEESKTPKNFDVMLSSIASKMNGDPEYRAKVRKSNMEKFGYFKLNSTNV